ncbi:MAG: AAA family ATPase [Gemmataceae bacterium]
MSVFIKEENLPSELDVNDAVEAAYSAELAEVASRLQRGLPTLIECEKELAPFLYANIRRRLRAVELRCTYLDGRVPPEQQGPMQAGMIGSMIQQLQDAVRGVVEQRVIVIPHLDLLTTTSGGLTNEAREVIPLMYENPELVWLGFKDPSFPIPEVIENLFPHRVTLLGIARPRLQHLITQAESRKFGKEFNPWQLYKYVSGINAVRLRKLLSTLEGEDFPADPRKVYQQIRSATVSGGLEIPNLDLDKDIGGYDKVKERLKADILDVLAYKESLTDPNEIKKIEELIPKGMIFWGPPGTGKTLFAKAMAASIGAAITIVSGPELKSKWVGESEERIRQIFQSARQSAPSIIVFDEMDSFASARGTYTGSGVEHSMVNQLLTELDGFHKEELVFVVGTTNFVEILDPALLRPGRFEFHLQIPYPGRKDREAILRIYNKKMKLNMTDDAIEAAVNETGLRVPGTTTPQFSGDHINALCRSLARERLRASQNDPEFSFDETQASVELVQNVLDEWRKRGQTENLTGAAATRVATHEAGHAVLGMHFGKKIDRITIESDIAGAMGFVEYGRSEVVQTHTQMLNDICTLMGGIEAEKLLLDEVGNGASGDLRHATWIARNLVEQLGLGGDDIGLAVYLSEDPEKPTRRSNLSEKVRERLDERVNEILLQERDRAAEILRQYSEVLGELAADLNEKKTVPAEPYIKMLEDHDKDEKDKDEKSKTRKKTKARVSSNSTNSKTEKPQKA